MKKYNKVGEKYNVVKKKYNVVKKMYKESRKKYVSPSWVQEARSETLKTPQNVPARTVSWLNDPV